MESYFGGKNGQGTYQFLINQIPKHKIYIEGFLGSGAIIKRKSPALIDIGIEVDTVVIDKYHFNPGYKVINDYFARWMKENIKLDHKDTFIYLDPPYLPETRLSKHKYNFDMTKEDHIDILKLVSSMRSNIAISCYDSSLYTDMLKGWYKTNYSNTSRQGKVIETLYTNYNPADIVLHDYKVLGKDFTDRQRIKRKVERHIQKLLLLPVQERQCIIDAINSNGSLSSNSQK